MMEEASMDADLRTDLLRKLLSIKVLDPAMGSGHFLVEATDYIAREIIHAREIARQEDEDSDAVAENDIHWARREVVRNCIYGVDLNPMAVELAKTALWLHTFTVGAPLSFLDHHLQTGDSLQGERFEVVERGLHALGTLFQQGEMQRLKLAADAIAQVADLTDADIGEVHQSQALAEEANRQLAPIHAVLDFWRALRWLIPGWPVAKNSQLTKLLKDQPERQAALVLSKSLRLAETMLAVTV